MPPYTTIPSAALTTVCMSAHSARVHICPTNSPTPPFSRGSIDIDHEKKVDLGVLRGADHDGLDLEEAPRPLDRLGVKKSALLQLSGLDITRNRSSAVDLLG